jgi:hypothetical protein
MDYERGLPSMFAAMLGCCKNLNCQLFGVPVRALVLPTWWCVTKMASLAWCKDKTVIATFAIVVIL